MKGLGAFVKKLDSFAANAFDAATRAAAVQIVEDLRFEGPWWTGDFARSWEIQLGDVNIEATDWGSRTPEDDSYYVPPKTQRVNLPPLVPPDTTGRKVFQKVRYTVGNRNRFRDIAMDLQPGRWRGGMPPNTASQDWYSTYLNGGAIDRAVKLAAEPILRREWER